MLASVSEATPSVAQPVVTPMLVPARRTIVDVLALKSVSVRKQESIGVGAFNEFLRHVCEEEEWDEEETRFPLSCCSMSWQLLKEKSLLGKFTSYLADVKGLKNNTVG